MRELPSARSGNPTEGNVFTVEQINKLARQLVESRFAQVWVEGEVSNLSAPGSGHLYFTLKDPSAQIRCAYFRNRRALLDFTPTAGMQVTLRARLTVYEPRGDLQLVVQHMEPAGEGALRAKFDKLRQALQAEGLFDPDRKQSLPRIPRRIGVITSPSGAAIRDIITTCKRRFPGIPLVIYPTPVQGETAVDGIVAALHLACRQNECDVLILARGGGSLEDLWAFNEEPVARTVAASPIPIVSGIGHESDVTIADMVADYRAATPTAAAQHVTPEAHLLAHETRSLLSRLHTSVRRKIEQATQRNDLLQHRLIHPTRRYAQARHRFQLLYNRLGPAVAAGVTRERLRLAAASQQLLQYGPKHKLEHSGWRARSASKRLLAVTDRLFLPSRQRLRASLARLNAVSPLATLERGYALATDQTGKVIKRAKQVHVGENVDVQLARGRLTCVVRDTRER